MGRTKTAMGFARRSKQPGRKSSQLGRAPQSLGGALDWSAEFVGGLDLVTRVGAETKPAGTMPSADFPRYFSLHL